MIFWWWRRQFFWWLRWQWRKLQWFYSVNNWRLCVLFCSGLWKQYYVIDLWRNFYLLFVPILFSSNTYDISINFEYPIWERSTLNLSDINELPFFIFYHQKCVSKRTFTPTMCGNAELMLQLAIPAGWLTGSQSCRKGVSNIWLIWIITCKTRCIYGAVDCLW